MKKLTYYITAFLATLGLTALALAPAPVHAQFDSAKNQACAGVQGAGGASCDDGGKVSGILQTTIHIMSIAVGFAATLMIIIAGFRYVTSGGDPSGISGAKNALIYALVGVVIVVIAQVLVRFVLTRV